MDAILAEHYKKRQPAESVRSICPLCRRIGTYYIASAVWALRQEAWMLLLKNRRGKPGGYAANERKRTPPVQISDGMPYSSCCEEFLHIPFRDESEDPYVKVRRQKSQKQ